MTGEREEERKERRERRKRRERDEGLLLFSNVGHNTKIKKRKLKYVK